MKFKRQAAILDIITSNEIKTQEELSARQLIRRMIAEFRHANCL